MQAQEKVAGKRNAFARMALVVIVITCAAVAQVPTANSVVPRLVNYTGVAKDADGKPVKGVIGATFAVYAEQEGGAPLWMETRNITAGANGAFAVMLGATKPGGLPQDVFSGGQARWLGISYNGGAEQTRVALLSVPYALKAGDAQTLGGLPASAFALAVPAVQAAAPANAGNAASSLAPSLSGSGTADFVPLWLNSTGTLGNSVLFQSGSGSTAKLGVNTSTPSVTLDVKGAANVRGTLLLPATNSANATAGFDSNPLKFTASSYNSSSAKAVTEAFQWQAEPTGNDTSAPSATLNLLFGAGTPPTETGLKINSQGLFTFASGQTFPGTGAGTITGVTAGTDLTGGGTSGNIALNLNTATTDTRYARLAAANTFTGNQSITGDLNVSAGVSVTGDSFFGSSDGLAALQATQAATNGSGAILGKSQSALAGSAAILGTALTTTTNAEVFGVEGTARISTAAGVYGVDGSQSSTGAVWASQLTNGSGVWGDGGSVGFQGVLGTSDNTYAILGVNNAASDAAVGGYNLNTTNLAPGVSAGTSSPTGIGVEGQGYMPSKLFQARVGIQPFGVIGEAGDNTVSAGPPIGVWGAADSGFAVLGENNSSSAAAGVFLNVSDTEGNAAFEAGSDLGLCTIDTEGNMGCNGTISGEVPAMNGARKVALYAMQSPENWFEDFGSGQLSNGSAEVALDPAFAETVNTGADYHVFPVPNGDCKGLYIAGKTASGFLVRELGSGRSNITFEYRVVAKRKGYENLRLTDVTERQPKIAASIRQLTKPTDPRTRPQIHMPGVRQSSPLHSGNLPISSAVSTQTKR